MFSALRFLSSHKHRSIRIAAPMAFFIISLSLIPSRLASQEPSITIKGDVLKELSLSLADIKAMPSFLIRDVPVIPERVRDGKDLELISQTTFRGVLLRDVLYQAGMKYKRKWEPGVLIHVLNKDKKELVFSFGEIFYSSTGRSILLAYEKDTKPCPPTLVVATDIHDGRLMENPSEINVKRVEVELLAYDDKAKNVTRPPSTELTLLDMPSKNQKTIKLADLKALPSTHVPAAVMIGDCEGYHGIHTLDGVPLSVLLKKFLSIADPAPYNRYAIIMSDDGYCAVYSFGDLFNSRMGNHIVVAIAKDGKPLTPADGFAMSVAGEDSTGGRSVRRIKRIEVH
jgi:DMSO/TMAO reductase YedYZ molybdopterin-dependent catalytic subunit